MRRSAWLSMLLCAILFVAACNRNKAADSSADNTNSPAAAAAPAESNPTPTPSPVTATKPVRKKVATKLVPPKPQLVPVVLPAGTVLAVRLEESLGSKTSQQGQRFQVSLSEPIVIGGQTVIPKGASGSGTVTEAHAAGRFKGGASLSLVLDSLTVKGVPYSIQTTPATQASKGKGKRTAAMVGGGAGTGALIGGLAGGGKGAAIGALVGAGAGTAGAGLTGNKDISLPVEAVVSFQMTEPLTLENVMMHKSPSPEGDEAQLTAGSSEESTDAPPPQQ
jgi:hypothetical protein